LEARAVLSVLVREAAAIAPEILKKCLLFISIATPHRNN